MTTNSNFNNEDQYDLLEDLLNTEYDTFDESDGKIKSCNILNSPKKRQKKINSSLEEESSTGVAVENMKGDIGNDELDIEEGELIDENSGPTEITSMINCDKTLLKAFHDNFHGKHLILKIYENGFSCPYCKLNIRK